MGSMDENIAAEVLEPPFTGAARHSLVDGLLAVYDEVRQSGTPRWVAFEAPSGAGKTRVVQEFYGRLAHTRQSEPAYWPASLLGSFTSAAADPGTRRKRVAPEVTHVPGSLPDYFWWGISASTRGGVASDALAQDMSQLEAHGDYLDDAWRSRTGFLQKSAADLRASLTEVSREGVSELLARGVEMAVGASVPLTGLIMPMLSGLRAKAADHSARRERLRSDASIGSQNDDVLDQVVTVVTRLAQTAVPVVLFIEDFHDADQLLADLVGRLIQADAAVLIITSGWPGAAARREHLAAVMNGAGSRLTTIDPNTSAPAPFPADASLAPLADASLSQIVRHYFPRTSDDTLRALVAVYENPYALELLCTRPSYRRKFADGELRLSPEQIQKLPKTVRDMYRAIWVELPEQVRTALALASLGVPPAFDSTEVAAELTWNTGIMLETLGTLDELDYLDTAAIAAVLQDASVAGGWARSLDATMQCFPELAQWEVAHDEDDLLDDDEREAFLACVARVVKASLKTGSHAGTASEAVYRVHLCWMLHRDHGLITAPEVVAATLVALDALRHNCADTALRLQLVQQALTLVEHGSDDWVLLANRQSEALFDANRFDDAIGLSLGVVDVMRQGNAPGEELAVHTINAALVLAEAGRAEQAGELLQTIDADAVVADLDYLDLEYLGTAFSNIGQRERACRLLEQAQAKAEEAGVLYVPTMMKLAVLLTNTDAERALELARAAHAHFVDDLGSEHPESLRAEEELLQVLIQVGETGEALTRFAPLVQAFERTFGPESSPTLAARMDEARAYDFAGDSERSLELFEQLVPDMIAALGPTAKKTMFTRKWHADLCYELGYRERAFDLWRVLHADQAEVFGGSAEVTVNTFETMLTKILEGAEEIPEEYVPLYELLLSQRAQQFGDHDPQTLTALNLLGRAHLLLDQISQAIAVFERAFAIARDSYGETSADTLVLRFNLGSAYEDAGNLEIARDFYDISALGSNIDPDGELAHVLGEGLLRVSGQLTRGND